MAAAPAPTMSIHVSRGALEAASDVFLERGLQEHDAFHAATSLAYMRWKRQRTHDLLHLYRCRDMTSPFQRMTPTLSTRMLCSGFVRGSNRAILRALCQVETQEDIKTVQSMLMPRVVDAQLVHVFQDQDPLAMDAGVAFCGIKWITLQCPGGQFVSAREVLCLERIGRLRRADGTMLVFHELQSIDPSGWISPRADTKRATLSLCSFYRQVSAHAVGCFVLGEFDAGGSLPKQLSDRMASEFVLQSADITACAYAKAFSKLVFKHNSQEDMRVTSNRQCAVCMATLRKSKTMTCCSACRLRICRACSAERTVFMLHRRSNKPMKERFCLHCISDVVLGDDEEQLEDDQDAHLDQSRGIRLLDTPSPIASVSDDAASSADGEDALEASSSSESNVHQRLDRSRVGAAQDRVDYELMREIVEQHESAKQEQDRDQDKQPLQWNVEEFTQLQDRWLIARPPQQHRPSTDLPSDSDVPNKPRAASMASSYYAFLATTTSLKRKTSGSRMADSKTNTKTESSPEHTPEQTPEPVAEDAIKDEIHTLEKSRSTSTSSTTSVLTKAAASTSTFYSYLASTVTSSRGRSRPQPVQTRPHKHVSVAAKLQNKAQATMRSMYYLHLVSAASALPAAEPHDAEPALPHVAVHDHDADPTIAFGNETNTTNDSIIDPAEVGSPLEAELCDLKSLHVRRVKRVAIGRHDDDTDDAAATAAAMASAIRARKASEAAAKIDLKVLHTVNPADDDKDSAQYRSASPLRDDDRTGNGNPATFDASWTRCTAGKSDAAPMQPPTQPQVRRHTVCGPRRQSTKMSQPHRAPRARRGELVFDHERQQYVVVRISSLQTASPLDT